MKLTQPVKLKTNNYEKFNGSIKYMIERVYEGYPNKVLGRWQDKKSKTPWVGSYLEILEMD
jgi:hypothetical protein